MEAVLGHPLQSLYEDVGTNLEGLVEYTETNIIRGEFATVRGTESSRRSSGRNVERVS